MKAILFGAVMALTITTTGAAEDSSANYMLPHCKMTTRQVLAAPNPPVLRW
jgi:hypothetical protein